MNEALFQYLGNEDGLVLLDTPNSRRMSDG